MKEKELSVQSFYQRLDLKNTLGIKSIKLKSEKIIPDKGLMSTLQKLKPIHANSL